MTDSLENILLALFGVLVGVLTAVFTDELKGWLGWTGYANKDLRGTWKCKWLVEFNENEPWTLDDSVEILRAGKREILARGRIEGHSYDLRGTFSQDNVLTLTYEIAKLQNLTGVVIVELDTLRKQFTGYWLQRSPTGHIHGGRTTWDKA